LSNQKKIVIFAAGTGGHIYPGISIAKKIIQNNVSVVWIGTKKGIENKIVSKEKIPIEHINFSGIRGKGYLEYIKLPFYSLKQ
jgi:UDP-N-acetylglucosamine--N-acetylmuramyl-(pentapeptide) pyrophosphoryl-undecaprenol N-acetylglucosamine transferase